MVVIRFFAAAGCSLSTLHLKFTLCSHKGDTSYTKQPYHEDLLQAIASVTVERKMIIRAGAYDMSYINSFNCIVNCLGVIKQWAITNDVYLSYVAEPWDGRTDYTREWVLEPADASTIDKAIIRWS